MNSTPSPARNQFQPRIAYRAARLGGARGFRAVYKMTRASTYIYRVRNGTVNLDLLLTRSPAPSAADAELKQVQRDYCMVSPPLATL